ncbi:MAG: M56 family metallopeptidase, partial [Bacteroidota bacterium]
QRHSLDILFIELLQVLLWFNPFIYLINKAIKLNHEFLADQAVLGKGVASRTYQNTLLSFSSQKYQSVLANAINYSSFKKRFTVMKKQTSKRVLWLKGLLLLPLTVLLLVSFSTTEIRYREAYPHEKITLSESIEVRALIKPDLSLWLNDKQVAISDLSEKLLEIVPAKSIKNSLVVSTSPGIEIPAELLRQLKVELREIGISTLKLNNQELHINEFPEDPKPVLARHGTEKQGASEQQLEAYNKLAMKYNNQDPKKRLIPEADQIRMAALYSAMNAIQKAHSEAFPLSYPINQEEATPEMVAEYNDLARKYNSMSWDNFRVRGSEVERLHYIYNRMSEAQKANAEPFPQFPEPPAEPKPVVAPTPHKESADIAASPSPPKEPVAVKASVGEAPSRPVLPSKPAMEEGSVAPAIGGELPPPPPPKSPFEFASEMAEKGADFYLDGQKITAEKAMEILKNSKRISLKSKHMGLERPVVELSTKPFKVKGD